jgi:hypothetical protein
LQIYETQCETPKPYSLFQSTTPELAYQRAAAAGLIVLFHDFDEHDAHERRWVHWALPSRVVVQLLCCLKDLRSADEFTFEERIVLNDLISKGLLKKTTSEGRVYYYCLDKNTAARLLKQLSEIDRK